MDTERPTLQHSETDGTGSMKRRRPALSCVECRRRKVKCDRDKPCGPCTRTKSPTCTYRPHARGTEQGITPPFATASRSNSVQGGGISVRSTSQSSVQAEFDSLANRYIAPGIFGGHGKNNPAPLVGVSSTRGEGAAVDDLVRKVRHLEDRLAAISTGGVGRDRDAGHLFGNAPPGEQVGAQFVKSKFYGESHWNNVIEPYNAIGPSNIVINKDTNRTEVNKASELYATVAECKRMARTIKASRMLHPTISSEVQESIPSKNVCNQLVDCYLRTFEGVFRVLHIPSFMKEYQDYWSSTLTAKPSIVLKMLLVCAIGAPFYAGDDQPRLRTSYTKWIQAAESWLSAPHEKSRLNMTGLQIQILLLLARQVCSVDGDLVWIPMGTLLRSAMHLGLHRDPSHIGKISVFHTEMRRRLWATVMEITVQSSLDMGMPPMISAEDYDTLPPSNINDEDLSEYTTTPVQPKPSNRLTQCSIQIAFYETLPLRLEITRLVNNLRFSLSYDETLRLGTELLTMCRKKAALLHSSQTSSSESKPNAFQIKLFDTLVRRFVLCVHRPFFTRAKEDPKYYYSRKICLDTSLAIAAPTAQLVAGEDDDWARLTYHGVGFLKHFFLHSVSTIFIELISQLEEQQDTELLTSTLSATPSLPPQLEIYRNVLVSARNISEQRLRHGETNAKGFTWLSCALARIDSLVSGTNADAAVLASAKSAVSKTAELMRNAYFAEHGRHIDLSHPHGPFAGRDHGRGEGADDVTGTPREADDEHAWDDGAETRVSSSATDGVSGGEDMDWERLMADDSLDFGWGFEGSPESWFGWGWEDGRPMGV